MNIPEHILQQVADEAFLSSNGGMMGLLTCNKEKNHVFWHEERYERRAVIQHALDNPALVPFLAALPRRESPALAQAIAIANRLAESLDTLTSVIGLTPIKGNLEALQEAFNQARQSLTAYENHKKGNTP